MSANEAIEHVPAAPVPTHTGQATAVEQSRAVAEVQAAVVVAQQVPRSISTARTAMQQSCSQLRFAERAFYKYPKGGSTVSGPSVHLARELARCFGNVQYGIAELRRDDERGESEMLAWAWDVQMNTRSSTTFIVPHKRDKRGGPEKLTDLRDVYENNANMGARRLREQIFSILPTWFNEEAIDLCQATLHKGDGRPVEERVEGAILAFDVLGVSAERLEQKLGRPRDKWNEYDVAQLLITHRSIQRREVAVDDEFPQPRVKAEEITERAESTPAPAQSSSPPPADEEPPPPEPDGDGQVDQRPPTQPMMRKLFKALSEIGVGDDKRHAWAADQLGLQTVESFDELTRDDVHRLIDAAEDQAKAGGS